ncbi:MAG: hypothetical protein ACOC33_02410 [bacterium]
MRAQIHKLDNFYTNGYLKLYNDDGTVYCDNQIDINHYHYDPPEGYLYEGLVSSGTNTTLTDLDANWDSDIFVDKIVRIIKNGDTDYIYTLVQNNDNNTLYFDSNLEFDPCSECGYEILHTLLVDELSNYISVNSGQNNCGIVLPSITEDNDRKFIYIQIEDGNGNIVPIVSRNDDTILGFKYATLEGVYETVEIFSHFTQNSHWDVINTYNIKRYVTGYLSNNSESVTEVSPDWQFIGEIGNLQLDNLKRFVEHDVDGINWIRYTSLVSSLFLCEFNAIIDKSGGGPSEISISIAKKEYSTGNIIYSDRISTTRYRSGEGVGDLFVSIPIRLTRGDEISLVVRKTIQQDVFTILQGSTLSITQL